MIKNKNNFIKIEQKNNKYYYYINSFKYIYIIFFTLQNNIIDNPTIGPHLPKLVSTKLLSFSSDSVFTLSLCRSSVMVGKGWRDMYSPNRRGNVTTAVSPATRMT